MQRGDSSCNRVAQGGEGERGAVTKGQGKSHLVMVMVRMIMMVMVVGHTGSGATWTNKALLRDKNSRST